MRIRLATDADLTALVALDSLTLEQETRVGEIRAWVAAGACQTVEGDGELRGYAVIANTFFHRPFIEMVMVGAPWRRHGYGAMLIQHLCLNRPQVWTSTNQSNRAMRALLEKLNFRPSGTIEGLDQGDPELLYRHE